MIARVPVHERAGIFLFAALSLSQIGVGQTQHRDTLGLGPISAPIVTLPALSFGSPEETPEDPPNLDRNLFVMLSRPPDRRPLDRDPFNRLDLTRPRPRPRPAPSTEDTAPPSDTDTPPPTSIEKLLQEGLSQKSPTNPYAAAIAQSFTRGRLQLSLPGIEGTLFGGQVSTEPGIVATAKFRNQDGSITNVRILDYNTPVESTNGRVLGNNLLGEVSVAGITYKVYKSPLDGYITMVPNGDGKFTAYKFSNLRDLNEAPKEITAGLDLVQRGQDQARDAFGDFLGALGNGDLGGASSALSRVKDGAAYIRAGGLRTASGARFTGGTSPISAQAAAHIQTADAITGGVEVIQAGAAVVKTAFAPLAPFIQAGAAYVNRVNARNRDLASAQEALSAAGLSPTPGGGQLDIRLGETRVRLVPRGDGTFDVYRNDEETPSGRLSQEQLADQERLKSAFKTLETGPLPAPEEKEEKEKKPEEREETPSRRTGPTVPT